MQYEQTLVAVVAQEKYEQTQHFINAVPNTPEITAHRELVSDFALARLPQDTAWMGFRDTYMVDGQRVRDHDARLDRLIAAGSRGALAEAQAVNRENSRFNLGSEVIPRTINVPTLVLGLIHPRNRWRFALTKAREDILGGRGVWVVAYKEHEKPTIIRNVGGRDVPATGSVWVTPDTGEILRTSLEISNPRDRMFASIVVDYAPDANVGSLVPVRMTESYARPTSSVTAIATYTNYRRFQTTGRVIDR